MNLEIAEKIKDVSQESIIDFEVLMSARRIIAGISEGVSVDELGSMLFDYSTTLSAKVATGVAYACLGNEGFEKMSNAIMENEIDNFINSLEENN